jgi:hypothetical protein
MMRTTEAVCAATFAMVVVATAVTVVAKITQNKNHPDENSLSGGDVTMASHSEASQPAEHGPAIQFDGN